MKCCCWAFHCLLLASHSCPEQGQGIYPSSWPFLPHRLREARSATPIWPLKQNCPSLRASRTRGQRLFKVFSITVRRQFAYGRIWDETRISKHLNWSQQLHLWECCQRNLAQPDVLQWWMKVLPLDCILLGIGATEQSGLQGIFTNWTPEKLILPELSSAQ